MNVVKQRLEEITSQTLESLSSKQVHERLSIIIQDDEGLTPSEQKLFPIIVQLEEECVEMILPDELAHMLINTDPAPINPEWRLPFDVIHLRVRTGYTINNCILGFRFFCLAQLPKGIYISSVAHIVDLEYNPINILPLETYLGTADSVECILVRNLLQLLDTKEVTLQTRLFDKQAVQKRIKREGNYIKGYVTLKLSTNLDTQITRLKNYHMDLVKAHWVRGHWKHFTSERYVNKIGTQTWVYPFVRGTGIAETPIYKITK